ncbi:FAD-dependent monooxygenase [Streptomyces sp. NPDC096934]|uniref:FAD-dependent monooxygenase n=1 Tax=Streptomyces sp. NPDC096934 TaxID=3155551 RepID=UPI0033203A59
MDSHTDDSRTPASEHVVVVGGGPVGLWLACELRTAGVPTTVLERTAERSPHSKALGIHARTVEVLGMRGAEERFLEEGMKVPNWHFGMLAARIDLSALRTPHPYMLGLPQARTEEILEARARAMGATVLRSHTVTGLLQDDSGVSLQVTGPTGSHVRRAAFVVGCDGAGSTVRKAAGIGFPGTEARVHGIVGDVHLPDLGAGERLQMINEHGALIIVPIPGGLHRVAGVDPLHQEPGTTLTLEGLRTWMVRAAGTDFGVTAPRWLSRFGNATRQAAAYRNGRVLLAGDAAHMHFPTGGVGLNVGLQDAMNLGWKLAAHVQARADADLLDTYHAERHPVGVALASHTLAQTALISDITPEVLALRDLLGELIRSGTELGGTLAGLLSGLDVSYAAAEPNSHCLTGTRVVPTLGPAHSRCSLFDLLRDGHPLFVNFSDEPLIGARRLADSLGFRVAPGTALDTSDPAWSDVRAAIVRPDGHVWWAGDSAGHADLPLDDYAQQALAGLRVTFTTPQK